MGSFHRVSCGARRKCVQVLALLLAAAPMAQAQATQASTHGGTGYWIFSAGDGASVPAGSTAATTNKGVVFSLEFGRHGAGRWLYPFNMMISVSNLPYAVLQTTNESNGQTNLFAFTFDPACELVRGRRWGMYAAGGGGYSLKQSMLLQPDPTCNGGYGYNACFNDAGSASSNQPVLDGGVGFTFRVRRNGIVQLVQDTRYVDMFTPKGSFAGFETAGVRLVVVTMGMRVNFAHGPNPATTPY